MVLRNLPKITTVNNGGSGSDVLEGPVHPVLLVSSDPRNFTAVNLSALTTLNLSKGIYSIGVLESVVLENLPELVSINVQYNSLSELVVLENLPELVSINVHGNSLSGLVLPFLPKLTGLYASNNQLTSVVLESSKLPALETLILHHNHLVEVELDGFTELRHVDLRSGNSNTSTWETLVLRNLPKITTVNNGGSGSDVLEGPVHPVLLVSSDPRNFTAVNLSALTTLNLSKGIYSIGVLESVVLENLPELVSINVQYNSLSELVVLENLPELVSINVHGNSLSGLVLPFLPKLTGLYASNNQLTSVVLESSKLPALETLILHHNHLVEVELDGFTELRHVDLRSGNSNTSTWETLVLRNLPKITTVNNGGSGSDVLEGPVHPVLLVSSDPRNFTAVNLSALTTLNLSKGIYSIGVLESVVLENLPELVSINVQYNSLSELVVLENLPELVSINVHGNSLSGLVLPFLPKLTGLYASNNQLTSVVLESSKLPALETLILHHNHLVEVELDGFTELRHVDLRSNALRILVLRNLPKITTVRGSDSDVLLDGNPEVKVLYDFPEDPSARPGVPLNLLVEAAGDGVDGRGSFTVRWDAPVREGDSAIEGYTVTVSHPRISPSVTAWRHSYEVTDRSFQFDHGDPGYTYEVWVRARNSFGSGEATTSQKITIGCINGRKYRTNREGGDSGGPEHWRIYALQDFKLVPNGWQIKQGYKGGVVFDDESLSQDGCAWIYENAAVEGNGKVSGNAVLVDHARVKDNSQVSGNAVISGNARVSDSAQVYGNAQVSGNTEINNSARVFDNAQLSGDTEVNNSAWVFGNARVSDNAKVYGDAHVYGNVRVSGDARIGGYARVFGNVVLFAGDEISCDSRGHESCNYNGTFEYSYAAKRLKENLYDSLYNDFLECRLNPSNARRSANEIVYPKGTPSSETYSQIAQLQLAACGRLKVYRDIIQKFTPGPLEFILQWAFLSGSALQLGTFGSSLLELLKGINDISTLIDTRRELDDILKDAHQMLRTK